MERIGGKRQTRDRLKAMLKAGEHATSSQVMREWNRIVFGACTELRKVLPGATDRMDVVNHMRKGYGRAAARNWQVTEWIMGSDTDLALVEKRVADYQRVRARAQFRANVGTVRDGTSCAVACRVPYRRGRQWRYEPMCKKTDDICDQPTFLEAELDRARAAASALEGSARKADRKMGQNATKALQGLSANGTKGKACHASNGLGGDICIALECASDEILLTTDESFDLICPAIGRQHEKL
jgi:hypothetical protein